MKIILTLVIVSNFYNIVRHFIYVRIALWRASQIRTKKSKYETEEMERVK